LHKPNARVFKMRQGVSQKIGRWDEVRVKNGDKLSGCAAQALAQRARLKVIAPVALYQVDVVSLGAGSLHRVINNLAGVIGGVIQGLDVQKLARVVQGAGGGNDAPRHVTLVKQRQLHRDRRQRQPSPGWQNANSPRRHPQKQNKQNSLMQGIHRQQQRGDDIQPKDEINQRRGSLYHSPGARKTPAAHKPG
jgi:hypothetical protein